MLLADDIFNAEAKISQSSWDAVSVKCNDMMQGKYSLMLTLGSILQANIQHSIIQSPTHEEFETKVVNALGVPISLSLLRLVPVKNQAVTKSQAGSRVGSPLVNIEHTPGKGCFDMAHNFLLELVWIFETGSLAALPGLALRLRNRGYKVRGKLEFVHLLE